MTDSRMLVVDASHSLFRANVKPSTDDSQGPDNSLFLQPIPDFQAMVSNAIKDLRTKNIPGRVVSIDIGVVCDISTVSAIARTLHENILLKLAAVGT